MDVRKWFQEHSVRLLAIRDTPNAIAGGVAIGIFFGFTPLFGLKTLLSIFIAWIFRCNLLAAAIGVTLHDLAFFFIPIILRVEYDIGHWLLSSPHKFPESVRHLRLHAADWLNWHTFRNVGVPLLVGSIACALPLSALSFWLTHSWVSRHQQKRQTNQPASASDRKPTTGE